MKTTAKDPEALVVKKYVRRETAEKHFDFPPGYLLENYAVPRIKKGKYLYFVLDEIAAWLEQGRVRVT